MPAHEMFDPPAQPYQSEQANNVTPPTLFRPWLPKTLGLTQVMITPNLDDPREFFISWPAQPRAVRYTVYVTPTPMFANRNKFQDVPNTQTSVTLAIPVAVPTDVVFYVWVSFIAPSGAEVFISHEPVYTTNNTAFDPPNLSFGTERDIISGADMKFYAEEIRRRHLAILENDGEDFFLYIRRFFGMPCVCTDKNTGQREQPQSTPLLTDLGKTFDPVVTGAFEANESSDPTYQADYRCPNCFGTGIVGGYFPKIRIKIRYGNLPRRIIKMKDVGLEFQHNFNSHTIWHPRIKQFDFVVRVRTNERFSIKEPTQSEWRGMPLHQEFNAVSESQNSMIYQVSDEKILEAFANEMQWDLAKWDWAVWQ